MVKFENDCVDCGLPCLGDSCSLRSVKHLYCDECETEVSTLYEYFDGRQLCRECCIEELFNELEVIE